MRSLAILFFATFCALVASADDCQAQLFRSRRPQLNRPVTSAPPIYHQPPGLAGFHILQDPNTPSVFPEKDYYTPRRPKIARLLDGKMDYSQRNPAEVDARYIGGFHQSYYNNIGIPSGDIGIRGNAYKWNTW